MIRADWSGKIGRCGMMLVLAGVWITSSVRGADVVTYLFNKGSNYVQTSSSGAVPVGLNPCTVFSSVYLSPAGIGTTAYLGFQGNPTQPLPQVTTNELQYVAAFGSRSDMDATFPNTFYTLQINTLHDGIVSALLSLFGDDYPNPPQINNYDLAQAINPSADFVISWNPYVNPATADFINWEIHELPGVSNAALVWRSAVPNEAGELLATNLQDTIPAGTLQTNHSYSLTVWFNRVKTVTPNYPNVPGFCSYSSQTILPLVTAGSNGAPVIIGITPTNVTVNVGDKTTFNVFSVATPPVYYQWQLAGTNVDGATNATLTLKNIQTNQAGVYTAVVSNAAGVAVSGPANLVVNPPNPLAFAAGNYAGLFADTNGVATNSAGFFSATITPKLTFSAKLQLAGKTLSFSGAIGADGKATNSVKRSGSTPLTVQLQINTGGGDRIEGTVVDPAQGWSAELLAYQSLFNSKTKPAPQAGVYTLLIPGFTNSAIAPAGYSFGTLKVTTAGKISASVTLADGTRFSQSTILATNGQWPLFFCALQPPGVGAGLDDLHHERRE